MLVNKGRLLTLGIGVILLLPGGLVAQAPWEGSTPIVLVSRELYESHPKAQVAVNVGRLYVGRGLEIPYAEVDRIAKLVPAQPGAEITIDKAMKEVPPLREAYQREPAIRELLDVARRLEGLTRHASTHAAGVVIAPEPIVEFAPLYKGTKEQDEITTQWAKDEIERIGLLKMDFLGLKTLTLIDDAVESIAALEGERPDLDQVALDDPLVYDLFVHARTAGIFQFESEGMKDILRRLKPEKFEDLVALNALYRPGPIGGGLIDDFIKRRHGKVKVEYPHPLLEEILHETYGVIVYQEQVMQIASVMAGYSLGEADILRRAMGKKKKEVMKAEAKKFVDRAKEKGIKTMFGAPNVLRGESQSGSMRALDGVEHGVIDILCSDYHPGTLLPALFRIAAPSSWTLPQAFALATSHPAEAVGMHDRGSTEVGRRADLIAIREVGAYPEVIGVWVNGRAIWNKDLNT